MKFQLNLTSLTLKKWTDEYFSVVDSENQFTTFFGGLGWWLEDQNHWISFTLTKQKIIAFYKQPRGEQFRYYRKEVPRQEIITLKFKKQPGLKKRFDLTYFFKVKLIIGLFSVQKSKEYLTKRAFSLSSESGS